MRRIFLIAVREFVATVSNRAFIIGLFIMPALIGVAILAGPRLFNLRNFQVIGDVAIVDPTGRVTSEFRTMVDPQKVAARRADEARRALAQAPESVRQIAGNAGDAGVAASIALGPIPDLHVLELPADTDIQQQKAWLNAEQRVGDRKHLALIVIQPDAVVRADGKTTYGAYDMYVPPNLDDRAVNEIQQSLREAIINSRVQARALDKALIDAIVSVPRGRSITVTKGNERQTVGAMNIMLPFAFGLLLFIGVITGGQALLTSTVEEKSNRVMEVLLSAVSPVELMAGKLLGQMAVSLVALSLYIGLGLAMLTSFSLFGLLNPLLIVYLAIFFVITYLVFGSLMMAIGSAVNEMREAQSLMMPIMLMLIIPYMLSVPISRDPNSTFSTVISFIPPMNTFGMLLRMASSTPPPWWQVWLSIGTGVASVFAAIWFTAKVFRIGLLMHGKPPNFSTLIRWARAA
jgi:ABC-type Na+ efflux pump permease subunit